MCGRYFLSADSELISEASRKQHALTGESAVSGEEVSPGSVVAVIARSKKGTRSVFPMRWGFSAAENSRLIINARSETAAQKPMFRDAFRCRRCLLPLEWYYEWETRQTQTSFLEGSVPRVRAAQKIKHAIRPQTDEAFYLACLYRFEPGQALPALVVLTRPADASIAFVHSRMPVMLTGADAEKWITEEANPAKILENALCSMQILQKYPS